MENSKICRLCLDNSTESIALFGDLGKELKIASIIAQYFWFEPKENDNFSNLICVQCWNDLKNFNEFYNRVKLAQDWLVDSDSHKVFLGESKILLDTEPQKAFFEKSNAQSSVKLLNADSQKEFLEGNNTQTVKQEANCEGSENENNGHFDDYKFDSDSVKSDTSNSTSSSESKLRTRRLTRKRKNKSPKNEDETPPKKRRGRPPKKKDNVKDEKVKVVTKPVLTVEEKLERKSKTEEEDKRIREFFELACKLCEFRSVTFLAVKGHYRLAHSIKRGYVTCCNKKFFRRGRILEHIAWHGNPNSFNCPICHKSYQDTTGLKIHMLNHADDDKREYKCDLCDKAYVKKYSLAQHMRLSHIPDHMKIHKCPTCNKTFGTHSYLQIHIRGVHDFAYATVCDICAKVFKSKAQCALHRNQEHSERKQKLQCSICETWHKNENGLYKHIRRSHNQEPQSCKICGKVSSNRDALRSHIRYVHESERLHKCSYCEKAFKKPLELKEHMASHTGGILYICSFCPKTFNSNANMHSHRKKMHPVEWLEDKERKSGPIPDIS